MEPRIPQRPLTHALDVQPRFGDYDIFGHVNNTVYLQYFDLGKAMFFTDILGRMPGPRDLGAVIVNINCNYYAPAVPAEPLRVLTGCTHLGDRSLQLHQQVVNATTGAVKADAVTVLAGFDPGSQTGAPLPDTLRTALAHLVG